MTQNRGPDICRDARTLLSRAVLLCKQDSSCARLDNDGDHRRCAVMADLNGTRVRDLLDRSPETLKLDHCLLVLRPLVAQDRSLSCGLCHPSEGDLVRPLHQTDWLICSG